MYYNTYHVNNEFVSFIESISILDGGSSRPWGGSHKSEGSGTISYHTTQ